MQGRFDTGREGLIKAAGFGLMLLIPELGPVGYWTDLPWLAPAMIFLVVPLVDFIVGEAPTSGEGSASVCWAAYHSVLPHMFLVLWLLCLLWTGHELAGPGISAVECAGLLIAAGVASGFATCAAHELLHRAGAPDQWAARVAMAMVCYGHFVVEHLHHHASVGRVEQGTVPRPGETVYGFILRNASFSFGNAHRVAESIRAGRKLGWWRNRVTQQHALTAVFAGLWGLMFGVWGFGLFVAQALMAIATVEMVQYFEHYALVRREGERIGVGHSWNSNGWMTNSITLNITRHSHHHVDPSVPYQGLRMVEGGPRMPLGYFGLAWLALVPALWRRVIDPLVPPAMC